MSRTLKITLFVVLVLALGVGSIPLWIDGVARDAVETGASDALGVPTTLEKLSLSLFGGKAELNRLRIKNPEGYDGDFFSLADGKVSVTYGSLMGDTVEIPEVTLDGIDLLLIKRRGESNYDTILDHMKGGRKAPEDGGGDAPKPEPEPEPAPEPETPEPAAEGKKFVIRRVVLRNVRVKAIVRVVGDVESEMTIPEMQFEDIGSDTDGAQFAGVIREFISKTLFAVVSQGGGVLPPEITKGLGQGLEGLGNLAKTGVKVLGEGGKKVLETGGEALKETGKTALEGGKKALEGVGDTAKKGIGGLFGGDKKKKEDEEK